MFPNRIQTNCESFLDLSHLYKFIQCDKFRMLSVSEVRTLLLRRAVTTSIYFTDAFYHVPIARSLFPYLGFKLGNEALLLQSYAIRSEHSSQSPHKAGGRCGPSTSRSGDLGSCIPG